MSPGFRTAPIGTFGYPHARRYTALTSRPEHSLDGAPGVAPRSPSPRAAPRNHIEPLPLWPSRRSRPRRRPGARVGGSGTGRRLAHRDDAIVCVGRRRRCARAGTGDGLGATGFPVPLRGGGVAGGSSQFGSVAYGLGEEGLRVSPSPPIREWWPAPPAGCSARADVRQLLTAGIEAEQSVIGGSNHGTVPPGSITDRRVRVARGARSPRHFYVDEVKQYVDRWRSTS